MNGEAGAPVGGQQGVDPFGYFRSPQPVIEHTDPAFIRVATLLRLLALEGPVPWHVDALLVQADLELTEGSRRQPAYYLELEQATSATTGAAALAEVDELLEDLRSTSHDLAWTLALTRARSLIATAVREFDEPPAPRSDRGDRGDRAARAVMLNDDPRDGSRDQDVLLEELEDLGNVEGSGGGGRGGRGGGGGGGGGQDG